MPVATCVTRIGRGPQFFARLREVLERVELLPELCGIVWQDVRAVRRKQFRYGDYFVVFHFGPGSFRSP
jgi:hypothetical protein